MHLVETTMQRGSRKMPEEPMVSDCFQTQEGQKQKGRPASICPGAFLRTIMSWKTPEDFQGSMHAWSNRLHPKDVPRWVEMV